MTSNKLLKLVLSGSLLCMGTLVGASTDNCDWPIMNHDTHNTRNNPCETQINTSNVANLVVDWQFNSATWVQGAPAVVNGVVYFADFGGNLYAKNVASGTDVFPPVNLGAACEGGILVTEDTIYTSTSDLRLHARNLDLTPKAAFNGGSVVVDPGAVGRAQILACPVIAENIIIIPIANNLAEVTTNINTTLRGGFQAFDATTGTFLWRTPVIKLNEGTAGGSISTAAIDHDLHLMFAGTSNATSPPAGKTTCALVAIDYRTGEIKWDHRQTKNGVWGALYPCGNDFDLGASPNLFTIHHKGKSYKVVGCCNKAGIYRVYIRKTGQLVWESRLFPKSEVPSINGNPGAAYNDGIIYTSSNVDRSGRPFNVISVLAQNSNLQAGLALFDGLMNTDFNYLHAVRAHDGKVLWTRITQSSTFPSMTHANGVLYTGNFRGEFRALDAANSNVLRNEATGLGVIGAPITVVDGRVFVGFGLGAAGGLRVYSLP